MSTCMVNMVTLYKGNKTHNFEKRQHIFLLVLVCLKVDHPYGARLFPYEVVRDRCNRNIYVMNASPMKDNGITRGVPI